MNDEWVSEGAICPINRTIAESIKKYIPTISSTNQPAAALITHHSLLILKSPY
jgi:hypothetical protein